MKSFKEFLKEEPLEYPTDKETKAYAKHATKLTKSYDIESKLSPDEMNNVKDYTNSSRRLNRHLYNSHTNELQIDYMTGKKFLIKKLNHFKIITI